MHDLYEFWYINAHMPSQGNEVYDNDNVDW